MANSFVRYTGNGVTTQFSLTFSYISTSHISATVDGVSTAFSWVNSSTIQFSSAPANGSVVELRRTTPNTALITYSNHSMLVDSDLNTAETQSLYLAQEAQDRGSDSLGKAADLNWDAQSKRIKNVTDPTSAQDAATKNYVDTTTGADQASLAAASAASAAASATTAANSAANIRATSTTSNTIGTGSKSFTIQAGKQFTAGDWMLIADAAAPSTNYMVGTVTSYNSTSGALVFNSVAIAGSGTKTSWTVGLSGAKGADAVNYLTTRGDLLRYGASGQERLPLGTAKQLLGSDGTDAKYLGWTVAIQKFTANGTYTPTSGMVFAIIECVGGGGGGSGTSSAGANTFIGSGGGGAGSYSRKLVTATDIGASKAVTIGAAGSGGASGANPGGDGGDTSVGVLCVGKGGKGAAVGQTGGAGGVAGTGDVTAVGMPGMNGWNLGGTSLGGVALAGGGGSTLFGGGGIPSNSNPGTGGAASGYGAGGAGSGSFNGGGAAAGGAGTAGYVVITEFCIA